MGGNRECCHRKNQEIVDMFHKHNHNWWSRLLKNNSSKKVMALFKSGDSGQVTSNDQEMADARAAYYKKLGADTEEDHFKKDFYKNALHALEGDIRKDTSVRDDAWYNEPVTEEEIAEARKCLVNGKSPGSGRSLP